MVSKTKILSPTAMSPLVQKGFTTWIYKQRLKELRDGNLFWGVGETEIRSSLSFLPLVIFFKIEYQ